MRWKTIKVNIKTVKEIMNKYNSKITDLDKEIPITTKVATNACIFKICLDNRGILYYDIIPSPLGTFYFEWNTKDYSVSVSIGESPIIEVETLNKKDNKCIITKYHWQKDIEKLLNMLKELNNEKERKNFN